MLRFLAVLVLSAAALAQAAVVEGVLPDGTRYRGVLEQGLLAGPARLDYSDGSWYEGQMERGLRHGRGEWQQAKGAHYAGEFSKGVYQGKGKITWPSGASYDGGFAQGKPEGRGVRIDDEGAQWVGVFTQGRLNGPGTYRDRHGNRYRGNFRNDQFDDPQGRYETAEGAVWQGHFRRNALNGPGEYRGVDGARYKGDFIDWVYSGAGVLTLADGSVYQGHFLNGEYAGAGVLTRADKQVLRGVWSQGRRISDEAGRTVPDPLEQALLLQGSLLEQALAAVPASTPAIGLYALSVAGDGEQSVFLREADYVADLLTQRFGAGGVVRLVNHRDHLADRPLATNASIGRALQTLAQRSGPEDIVFIYLTSHGSAVHELFLQLPRLELQNLSVAQLAQMLTPLRDRYKVLVISACYSGGFIEPLKDDKTLIMTASRADRVSFGCSDTADFTYFGRALFEQALQQTDDLEQAFALASDYVAKREREDGFEPSVPQLWAPQPVLAQWRKLRQQTVARQPAPVVGGKP